MYIYNLFMHIYVICLPVEVDFKYNLSSRLKSFFSANPFESGFAFSC